MSHNSNTNNGDDNNNDDDNYKEKKSITVNDNTNNDSNKVAFSLGKRKKKKPSSSLLQVNASEFGQVVEDTKKKIRSRRTEPLVIPLPSDNRNSLLADSGKSATTATTNETTITHDKELDDKTQKGITTFKTTKVDGGVGGIGMETEDDKAAQALMEQAANHFDQKEDMTGDGATNFSSKGDFVIEGTKDTFKKEDEKNESNKDKDQFQKDLQNRPEDIPVESDVYENVPITEFGAAMLRGMGWAGNGNGGGTLKKNDSMSLPRPHRLGLGATPKLSTSFSNKKMLRPDQLKRKEQEEQQRKEYEIKRQEQLAKDKQRTLQNGSIVEVLVTGEKEHQSSRAKMIQLMGVPGLNRVLVQYEHSNQTTSVKRGDVHLVSREDLNEQPWVDTPLAKTNNNNNDHKNNQIEKASKEDVGHSDHDGTQQRRARRDERDHDRDSYDRRSSHDRDYHNASDNPRSSRREEHDSNDRRRLRRDEEDYYRDDDRRRRRRERSSRSDRYDDGDDRRRQRSSRRDDYDDRKPRRSDRNEGRRDSHDDEYRDSRSSSSVKRKSSSSRRNDDDKGEYNDYDRDSKRIRRDDNGKRSSEKYRDKTDNHHDTVTPERWLIPNIRVRVISKRYGSHQYKQKALVLDVTHGGAYGTLQMMSDGGGGGVVLDKVADRHLETALPKVGGNAIVLTGRHKYTKGQLMERNSKTGKGIIQIFEDMSLLTLSLDDIAEWCGPLDDDMAMG